MASFNNPLADKGKDTRNRLERCWSATLNWELFPESLSEVDFDVQYATHKFCFQQEICLYLCNLYYMNALCIFVNRDVSKPLASHQ